MVKIEFFPEPETVFKNRNEQIKKYPLCLTEDPLLELVLKYKQDFSKVTVADPISLEDLISENIEDKPVSFPKREILGEEFTDEDYKILCSKLSFQHEQFKKHQIRDIESKVERIKSAFARLTKEEIFFAFKEFEYNEDEVTICLTKNEFVNQIRNQISQLRNDMKPKERVIVSESGSEISEDEELISYESSDESSSEEVEHKNSDQSNNVENTMIQKRKIASSKSSKKVSRLRLDDALANVTDMEGWSEARIRAYQGMKKNPNAYFYRFNAPGETQKNGPWSKEEHKLFMERLAEFGADGQWGIFSTSIPGRVGYQCSNYYRKLIEIGRIKDSNYLLDEKGKAHYIGGKTKAAGVKTTKDDESVRSEHEEAEEEVKEEQIVKIATSVPTAVDIPRGLIHENPLPGFIDAITQVEVARPAISPYGHVLSYDTWLKCLLNGDRKNTCPLTNQPLHKRQLIFLTFENIEMYRDKIRHK